MSSMNIYNTIRFAKTSPNAITPTRAKNGDAGWDLTAIDCQYVDGDVPYYNYEFGIAVEIPLGFVGLLFPRSSISSKDLMLTNCVGVIDSGYRGSLSARFKTIQGIIGHTLYAAGDRVAQLVIVPCFQGSLEEVSFDQLSSSERGFGGFGHSGR